MMRIDWMKTELAKELLGHLTDLTGAVEGVVCLMDVDIPHADGGPGIRLCWFDAVTGRFVDSYTGTAYNADHVKGWALAWADVLTLQPVDEQCLVVPIVDCTHKHPDDGTCMHRRNLTPECHVIACPRLSRALSEAFTSSQEKP